MIDAFFTIIILIQGMYGTNRGFIKSAGGLISLFLSGILARICTPAVAEFLYGFLHIGDKINSYVSVLEQGNNQGMNTINDSLSTFNSLVQRSGMNINGVESVSAMVTGFLHTTITNISSIFVMIILFSIFMFIFGYIVGLFNDTFNKIPLGTTVNKLLGFGVGAIKGIIIVSLVFYVLTLLNCIPGVNIPLETTHTSQIIHTIGGLFENVRG